MNDTERRADGDPRQLEHLSALVDGELEGAAADHCCLHWREQTEARRRWHEWHLIGDVLRSEELACGATRGARFVDRIRSRLADEPVVLAPAPEVEAAVPPAGEMLRRRSWRVPVAVAAGFMVVVAGTLVATRAPSPSPGLLLTAAPGNPPAPVAPVNPLAPGIAPSPPGTPGTPGAALGEPQFVVADGQLVRDLRLDRYLAAHKQFGGSSVLGVPSGFLRSATLQTPER